MTPAERARLIEAFQRDEEDDAALADTLYLYKLRVYSDTLGELADTHGYEYGEIRLSESIQSALRAEAEESARMINQTYNRDITEFIVQIVDEATYEEAVDSAEAFTLAREDDRAEMISVTEAYQPHADATLAFYRSNGVEPEFDFGGHGDDHAECAVCRALEARNPHPLGRVLAVGSPHIQCRQRWRARVQSEDLPDELVLGDHDTAGLVGGGNFVQRSGGLSQAVEAVNALD